VISKGYNVMPICLNVKTNVEASTDAIYKYFWLLKIGFHSVNSTRIRNPLKYTSSKPEIKSSNKKIPE